MDSLIAVVSELWPLLAGAGACVLLAAFFAAAETSLLFANKTRLHQLADEGNTRAEAAVRLSQERNRMHNALVLIENMLLVLAVALVTAVALRVFERALHAVAAASMLMGLVVVLCAKLAPKGLAARDPDQITLLVALPLLAFMRVLSPLASLVAGAARFFSGPATSRPLSCTAVVTEEDIKAMINLGEEEGALKEEEKELLHKIFEFGDTVASEAMRPRTEIVNVPTSANIHQLLTLVSQYGYSRYPVIEKTMDSVAGIIYIKDILVAMATGDVKREDPVKPFIRPAYFIPGNKRVSDLLQEMQRDKFQIAIVIDEFGGTAGLVTLEDLIEEIVGSIHDELDSGDKDVQIVDEKNVVVSGQSAIDEVNELLGTKLQTKDFNTIGGLVFGLFGRMPRAGEQLRYKDIKFEVLDLDGRKIDKIKITKL